MNAILAVLNVALCAQPQPQPQPQIVAVTTGRWSIVWNSGAVRITHYACDPATVPLEPVPVYGRTIAHAGMVEMAKKCMSEIIATDGHIQIREADIASLAAVFREAKRIQAKAQADPALADFEQPLGKTPPASDYSIRCLARVFYISGPNASLSTALLDDLLAILQSSPRLKRSAQSSASKRYCPRLLLKDTPCLLPLARCLLFPVP